MDSIEEIKAYVKPPWWTPTNLTININNAPKDKAKEQHEETFREQANDPNALCIYTDGSGIAGHIGAAVYSPTTQSTNHKYLGKDDTTNVYAAELTAIHLAMNMAEKSPAHFLRCSIYANSQSSIQAVNKPKQQSGQYIIASIHHRLDKIKQHRPDLSFQIDWVPGHRDIPGNEKADEEAKKAAKEKLTGEKTLLHS